MTAGHLGISSLGNELLDDPGADPAAVTLSLRNVARAIQLSMAYMNQWAQGFAEVVNGQFRAEMKKLGKDI